MLKFVNPKLDYGFNRSTDKGLVNPTYYDGRYRAKKDLDKSVKHFFDKNNVKTETNNKKRQPVLVNTISSDSDNWELPFLTEFGFAKWISPEDIYREIYQFLSWLKDNPEIPNNQTNVEKIVSHGFDLKESFRNRK